MEKGRMIYVDESGKKHLVEQSIHRACFKCHLSMRAKTFKCSLL